MADYKRADLTVTNDIKVTPGQWFIDTDTKDWLKVVDGLIKVLPKGSFVDQLESGRGQVMVRFKTDTDILIPNGIAKETGHWYRLPEGETLKDASEKLYGASETAFPIRSFWEWLVDEHPEAAASVTETADVVTEKTKEVAGTVDRVVRGVIIAGALVGGAVLLARLFGRR